MDKGFAEMGEKMDRGFSEVKDEIRVTREELGDKLESSISHTEAFHTEMVEKFEYLDEKYGEFSKTLNMLAEKMDGIEREIKEIKDAFIKLVNYITEK